MNVWPRDGECKPKRYSRVAAGVGFYHSAVYSKNKERQHINFSIRQIYVVDVID